MRGRDRRLMPAGRRTAFTLLEVILAIALVALLSGVLLTVSSKMIGPQGVTPEEAFWKAVQQSRQSALQHERDVRLSFNAKDSTFVLDDGTAPAVVPVPVVKDLTIDFLAAQGGKNTVLIGGELVDAQTVPYVTFFSDGTCSPFRVQFRSGGPARVVAIDPWTCARVLPKSDGTN